LKVKPLIWQNAGQVQSQNIQEAHMQKDERLDNSSSHSGASNQQLAIITQLYNVASTFYHIDELFYWLARTIIQRFDIQVAEFWTTQGNSMGLRAIACQDASLPRHVVWNNQISDMAEHILHEQHHLTLVAVVSIFSAHQASLLNRYGLNYCCGYLLNSQPPGYSKGASSTSTASNLLFFRHAPPQNLLTSTGLILEQVMPIAKNRGLLVPAQSQMPSNPPQQQPALLELIPRRSQNPELLRTSNPLASSVDIANKQARRLFASIDGRKNLGELARTNGLNAKEVYEAVQLLLGQNRIEMYEPGGQPVKNPHV